MSRVKTLALAITATLPAIAPLTFAAPQAVEQMIVTGTRSEQPSVEIPASIQIVTGEQIKQSGASTLVQVLNAQAGIQIRDSIGNGGRGASISMRGFGENSVNNVLILVDGRRLNNPTLEAPNLSTVALHDIERVEIIQGSAGTLYGDQATGGVINIITSKPEALSGHVAAGRGSDDLEFYRAAISQGFDNGVSFRLSGEKKLSDNYRDSNEANYSNFLANIAYENQRFGLFTEILDVQDDLALPGSLSRAQINDDRRQVGNPNEYANHDTRSYRVGGHVNLNESWKLAGEYTDREGDVDGSYSWAPNGKSSQRVKSFNPRLIGDIKTAQGSVLITAGADLQDSEYQSTFTFADSTQETTDVYAQAVIPVIDKLKVTVGGRHSKLEETDKNSQTDNDKSITAYQFGAAYQLSNDTRIFLRRDEGFRWATIDENAFSDKPAGQILDAQESTSWELGIEKKFSDLALSALVYDMTIDGEIFYDPIAFRNSNLDKSDRQGIVLDSHWQVNDKITLQTNYSYVDAEISAGGNKGNTVPFVAKQTANLVLSYQVNAQWSFYADAQYTGKRYKANDDSNNFGQLGGYTVYNANARWTHDQLYVNLRANNLTGKEYEGFTSRYNFAYPSPELTYEVSIGYQF